MRLLRFGCDRRSSQEPFPRTAQHDQRSSPLAFRPFLKTMTYMVMLADDFRGVGREIGAGHFYDLEDKQVPRMGYTQLHLKM